MKVGAYWCIALLSFFSSEQLNAQTSAIDSLKNLAAHESNDTIRLNLTVDVAKALYRSGRFDESLVLADSIRKIATALNYPAGIARGWLVSGYANFVNGNYGIALEHFDEAQRILQKFSRSADLANVYLYKGQVHDFRSEFDSAIIHYQRALGVLKIMPDSTILANVYNSMGIYYLNRVSYETAIEYFYSSIAINERKNNKRITAATYNNLGSAFEQLKQYDDALRCYSKTLALSRIIENKKLIALSMTNIAGAQLATGNSSEARENLAEAFALQSEINDNHGLVFTYTNLAKLYRITGQPARAEELYSKAITLTDDLGDQATSLTPRYGLCELYFTQGKLSDAVVHLEKFQAIAQSLHTAYWLEQAYLLHSKVDSARNDFKGAYKWFKSFKALEDSLFSFRKTTQIAKLKEIYESEKKDSEIRLLRQEKKINQIHLAGAILIAIVILGLAITVARWKVLQAKRKKELAEKESQIFENRRIIELQKRKLAEEHLREQINHKNKELTSYTLNLIQKNETLEEIREKLQNIRNEGETDIKVKLNSLIHSINFSFTQDREWENFKVHFEQVHESFFENLRQQYPDLTPNDMKLCALLRLNFPTKKIATMLDISYDSAKVARYRLRKKLGLPTDQSLSPFLASL
jgi:tetratricopeptide (TPR) repeat protein